VAEDEDPSFARMAEIPKFVFSTTLEPPLTWANTQVVAEDAVTALRRMKAEGSASLRTMGSISLNKTLLREGLVDTLQLVVTGQTGLQPIFCGLA
jgi:dihydrofolate reductase